MQDCKTSRLRHFLESRLTDGCEVIHTLRPPFIPRMIPGTLFWRLSLPQDHSSDGRISVSYRHGWAKTWKPSGYLFILHSKRIHLEWDTLSPRCHGPPTNKLEGWLLLDSYQRSIYRVDSHRGPQTSQTGMFLIMLRPIYFLWHSSSCFISFSLTFFFVFHLIFSDILPRVSHHFLWHSSSCFISFSPTFFLVFRVTYFRWQ
jgi:hypothetical protein